MSVSLPRAQTVVTAANVVPNDGGGVMETKLTLRPQGYTVSSVNTLLAPLATSLVAVLRPQS